MPEYLAFRIKYHSVKVCHTSILERKNPKSERQEVQGHSEAKRHWESTCGKPCAWTCTRNSRRPLTDGQDQIARVLQRQQVGSLVTLLCLFP